MSWLMGGFTINRSEHAEGIVMLRFSVIIPVHNRPGLVRQSIDSVLSQSFDGYEIIVVDDGSTDDTPAVLWSYGSQILAVTQSNQGCEVARNAGAATAGGEYLAFLDSDDLMFPWALQTYDRIIANMDQPALLISRIAYFSSEQLLVPERYRCETIQVVEFDDYLSRDRSVGSTVSMIVIRKDVFCMSNGFRHSSATTFNMSDHDFLLRVGCHGPVILVESPSTVAYRSHRDNSTSNTENVVAGMLRIIRAEKNRLYPGGRTRRFDRYASIGGPTLYWSKQTLQRGHPLLALRLFIEGFLMVIAKILKKILIMCHGLKSVMKLEQQRKNSKHEIRISKQIQNPND